MVHADGLPQGNVGTVEFAFPVAEKRLLLGNEDVYSSIALFLDSQHLFSQAQPPITLWFPGFNLGASLGWE